MVDPVGRHAVPHAQPVQEGSEGGPRGAAESLAHTDFNVIVLNLLKSISSDRMIILMVLLGVIFIMGMFIEGIAKGKTAPKEDLPIVNKMCQFHPHVQVGMSGQTVDVKNEDPMLHNTHMRFKNLTVFNSALPRQGMTIKRAINKTGLVDVQCDAHTFMHGFLYLADNPYITVTDAQGRFSIKDVPAGTYKLKFWHEAFGEQEKSVTVTAGGAAEVNIEFGK